MVRLVPSFLKNVIPSGPQGSARNEKSVTKDAGSSSERSLSHLEDILKNHEDIHPPIMPILDKEALEVTTSIATIALIDWAPPKSGARAEDSGSKSIFNIFASEHPGNNKVPRVQESDFALYMQQIGDFWLDETQCVDAVEPVELASSEHPSPDQVEKEYFEESYQLNRNGVFQLGLEKVPESIACLESQLHTVNMQLSDLVGTHLRHVSNSFSCVGEIKDCFLNVNDKLSGIRSTFDSVQTHLYSSVPSDAPESQGTLPQVLAKRKEIRDIISKLETLKAIVSTPDYIQGIVDINNLALAHIFCTCSINYFGDLSKFALVNSISLVIKDTVANLERVADAKFIDLVNYTFTECFVGRNVDLSTLMGKIEPLIIVLVIESSLPRSIETLEEMYSRAREDKMPSAFPKDTLECIRSAYKCYVTLVQHIICISLMQREGLYMQSDIESKKVVAKVLAVMATEMSNGTLVHHCDYSTLLKATAILKDLLKLPQVCQLCSLDDKLHGSPECRQGDVLQDEGRSTLDHLDSQVTFHSTIIASIKSLKTILDTLVTRHLSASLDAFCANEQSGSVDALYSHLELLDDSSTLFMGEMRSIVEWSLECVCRTISREYGSHLGADAGPLVEACKELWADNVQSMDNILAEKLSITGRTLVESLYAECLGNVHGDLLTEDWTTYQDLYYDCDGTIKPFKLSRTVLNMYEQLKVCQKVCKRFPDNVELLSRCINTFAHYNTLMETQIDEADSIRKFCLILESLRFFTFLIPEFVMNDGSVGMDDHHYGHYGQDLHSTHHAHSCKVGSTVSGQESPTGLGSNAEKCVAELERLYKRALESLSGQMFASFTPLLLNWVYDEPCGNGLDFLHTDHNDGQYGGMGSMQGGSVGSPNSLRSPAHSFISVTNGSEGAEECLEHTNTLPPTPEETLAIAPFIHSIKEAFEEMSEILGSLEDLRYVFKTVFDKLLIVITSQDPPIEKNERFSDDCTKILTGLLHCTQIKLEAFAFANALSNELA